MYYRENDKPVEYYGTKENYKASKGKKKFPVWALVLIIISVLVAGGAIGYFVLNQSKGKNKKNLGFRFY
jgi:flagellar basal body-associated protein FliL